MLLIWVEIQKEKHKCVNERHHDRKHNHAYVKDTVPLFHLVSQSQLFQNEIHLDSYRPILETEDPMR
jgi:hypothetical protein